jgi:hypothetical protein
MLDPQTLHQLYTAVIAAIVLLVAGGAALIVAIFKLIPQMLKYRETERETANAARLAAWQKKQEQVVKDQEAAREQKLAELKADADTSRALTANFERMLDAFMKQQTHLSTQDTALKAASDALVAMAEQIGIRNAQNEKFYSDVHGKLDAINENGTRPIREMMLTLTNTHKMLQDQVGVDGNITRIVLDIHDRLNLLEQRAGDAIRHKTQPIQVPDELKDKP